MPERWTTEEDEHLIRVIFETYPKLAWDSDSNRYITNEEQKIKKKKIL